MPPLPPPLNTPLFLNHDVYPDPAKWCGSGSETLDKWYVAFELKKYFVSLFLCDKNVYFSLERRNKYKRCFRITKGWKKSKKNRVYWFFINPIPTSPPPHWEKFWMSAWTNPFPCSKAVLVEVSHRIDFTRTKLGEYKDAFLYVNISTVTNMRGEG